MVVEVVRRRCDRQLEIGKAHRIHEPDFKASAFGDDFVAFHSMEYGDGLTDGEIELARDEVKRAIETFFSMNDLIERLRSADRLITQRPLVFEHTDTSVRAVPDVIVFNGTQPPAIIDWKVHVFGRHDAWLQLAVYAAALTRCSPHRDFPIETGRFNETEIDLIEVQLLTGAIRTHKLHEEHIARADAYIAQSAESMTLAIDEMNGSAATLPPTDFPATQFAGVCGRCAYKSLCWEAVQ